MSKKTTKTNYNASCSRLGTVGGQALIEGVMMKSKKRIAFAVRRLYDGKIHVRAKDYVSIKDKHKWVNIPILRGVVNFAETLIMSFTTLTDSTEMLGIEEEPGKLEKWLTKVFGKSIMSIASFLGIVIGILISIALFMLLPSFLVDLLPLELLKISETGAKVIESFLEGFLRIVIFIAYILSTSLLKDIRRTYQYHGAEHKSIFCYEKGLDLTVENVREQKRFHPRCGTSFIFVVLIVSIIGTTVLYSVLPYDYLTSILPFKEYFIKVISRLFVLPLIVGVSYEFIMYAGKHDNLFTRILSAPGLLMQRITTKEPDDSMIEVAIVSLKTSLIEEFQDFEIPFEDGYSIHGKVSENINVNEKLESFDDC